MGKHPGGRASPPVGRRRGLAPASPRFSHLLDPDERRRLRRLLPGPPEGDPGALGAPPDLAARWEDVARRHLRRVLPLLDRVRSGRGELVAQVAPERPGPFRFLSGHGSLGVLGAPESGGRRIFRYVPLLRGWLQTRHEEVLFTRSAWLGHSLILGPAWLRSTASASGYADLRRQRRRRIVPAASA